MPVDCDLPADLLQELKRNPIHTVVRELGKGALGTQLLHTKEFQRLIGYLLERADGRDRREPLATVPGIARPVPKLRVEVDACFGAYADLQWFQLNKLANGSRQPLLGLFPRMAATMARISTEDFGDVIEALISSVPDSALMRLFHDRKGKIRNLGLQLFSRIAFAVRPDQYFILPAEWAEPAGVVKYIGNDMRKYCMLCRTLRNVCDQAHISAEVRAAVFDEALSLDPPYAPLQSALYKAIGPMFTRASVLEPNEAYSPASHDDEQAVMPLQFAAMTIRARRGETRLRTTLMRLYTNRCALTGECPRDLLEVAYVVPFPAGDVNAPNNAFLVRSDLHTLWDLNLIGVEPESLAVNVSDKLTGSAYEQLKGRQLLSRSDGSKIGRDSLRERWQSFLAARNSQPPAEPAPRRKVAPTVETVRQSSRAAVGRRTPTASRGRHE